MPITIFELNEPEPDDSEPGAHLSTFFLFSLFIRC